VADIDAFVTAEAEALVAELTEWCRIPSISTDPAYDGEVRRSAEHLVGLMEAGGLHAEILEVAGAQPAVYGEWLGAGPDAPTITIYGHHDVQPVDPLELWQTPPFEPVVRDGCLYARGASDDKGQIHFQLAAVRHLLAADRRLPVNLKFIVEGEEEAGSPNIEAFLAAHGERLAADVIVVSDTGLAARDVVSMVTSMRGLIYAEITLRTGVGDLHSGVFGGTVPNAAATLVERLGRLKDERGRIAIPGWYDDVRELTDEERRNIAALPFDPDEYLRTAGVRALVGERGYSPLERVGGRPSADVNGVWAGYTGEGAKTVIPAESHAKVSFRLVADQEPGKLEPLFEQWVREQVPDGCGVTLRWYGGVRPCLTPIDHPGNQAAARAVERAFGAAPLFIREGGSGPERALSDALGAPCVYIGVILPEDHIHAPNERLHLDLYHKGLRAAAYSLEEFARPEVAEALRALR
jgi:acetylornithine deacetylase/succinyl-diaminopimelate desuccinylase-like protein